MFRNYLILAFRSMKRQRLHAILNILGLTIGIAAAVIIFSFLLNEWQYDRFHEKSSQIYRIITGNIGQPDAWAGTPAPLGPALKNTMPEVENFVRLDINEYLVHVGQKHVYERKILCADPSLFQMFSFPVLKGNLDTFLSDPNAIVISEATANKYFSSQNPMGQLMVLDGQEYHVTGVIADIPIHSHLHFDMVVPFEKTNTSFLQKWDSFNFSTYILSAPNVNQDVLLRKIQNFVIETDDHSRRTFEYMNLQPLTGIHFQYIRGNFEPIYDLKFIYILGSVAAFILLLASINYINLTTALAPTRAKEVGIKKVIGSSKARLLVQFLTESYLHVILAVFCAICLIQLTSPLIAQLLEKEVDIDFLSPPIVSMLAGIILSIGFLSGSYPAFLMSFYNPAVILKGKLLGKNKSVFRNVLVVFQFSTSIFLIIGTLICLQQLNLLKNRDLGMDRELIVNVPVFAQNKNQALKNEFLKHPNVLNVSANSFSPGSDNRHQGVTWEGQTDQDRMSMYIYFVDKDFFATFDIPILEGQDMIKNYHSDKMNGFVLNEEALKKTGWTHAAGKRFSAFNDPNDMALGVVKNFNFRSLHHQIEPCVLIISDQGQHISVKISKNDVQGTLEYIKTTLKQFTPNAPFEYYFVDDVYNQLYHFERTSSRAILFFTILSVLISSLGLFGLASFMVLQRTKEVGIRKVIGASIFEIVSLLTKEYAKWILIANVLAWPLAWFAMHNWLHNFAYHINITIWPFLLAGLTAMGIALITVSWQTVKSATANPINALKYE